MIEPLRSDADATIAGVSDRDRIARLEDLLLSGLDHYFAGQHELAINVWTRVLFLDRGHARARAYIERARSAVSERQREGDELIQTGAAAFQRGDAHAARRLLTSGMEHGAGNEEALALLERLDRLAAAGVQQENRREPRPGGSRQPPVPAPTIGAGRSRVAWIAAGAVLGVATGAVVLMGLWGRSTDWLRIGPPAPPATDARPVVEAPPLPSRAEVLMARAHTLRARGRLHDALSVLDAIRPADAQRADADVLLATIQAELLTAARSSRPASTPSREHSPAIDRQ